MASTRRNQGSASAAADAPENGSSGNLGLKTSLRVCEREPDGLLGEDEEAAAIAARVVVVMRRGEEEERACWRGRTGSGEEGEDAEKLGLGWLRNARCVISGGRFGGEG